MPTLPGSPARLGSTVKAKEEVWEWVSSAGWVNPCAVTINLPLHIIVADPDTGRSFRIPMDRIDAERALRHAMNRLNQRLISRGRRRAGEAIRIFSLYEGSVNGPIKHHFHLLIDRPPEISQETFFSEITLAAQKTNLGADIHLTAADHGWLIYLLKERSKFDESSNDKEKKEQRVVRAIVNAIDVINTSI